MGTHLVERGGLRVEGRGGNREGQLLLPVKLRPDGLQKAVEGSLYSHRLI